MDGKWPEGPPLYPHNPHRSRENPLRHTRAVLCACLAIDLLLLVNDLSLIETLGVIRALLPAMIAVWLAAAGASLALPG